MSATIPVTVADLRLVEAFRSLAATQPQERRAAHLVPQAEEMAQRIRRAMGGGR